MKERISITVDENRINMIEKILKNKKYRNRSHFIENAVDKLIEEEKNVRK